MVLKEKDTPLQKKKKTKPPSAQWLGRWFCPPFVPFGLNLETPGPSAVLGHVL